VREFRAAGRKVVGSAPVGREGTAAWLQAIGDAATCPGPDRRRPQRLCRRDRGALGGKPIKGRITLSGYEGSELICRPAAGRKRRGSQICRHGLPENRMVAPDAEWLEAHGVHVEFRASLEQDLAAMAEFKPDLAIGTTPVVQKAKEQATPALYFTNLISARPLMGPAGAGSLAAVVNAAIANKARFDR
jgi:chlorophyllide a reductase subunit Y